MKFRIFFLTIGSPIACTLLLLWPPMDRLSIRLFLVIAISSALLISLFFNKKKYVGRLVADASGIDLEYIRAALVSRKQYIPLTHLQDVQLSADGFRYGAAGVLHLKTGGKWESYIIVNKKTFRAVQQSLSHAGLDVAKTSAPQTA